RALLLIGLAAIEACAPAPKPKSAHDYYVEGTLAFQVEQWDEARRGFENAYLIEPDPALLFDIGQANRHLGHYDQALQNYQDFLAALPDTPKRAAVEQMIAEMRRLTGKR